MNGALRWFQLVLLFALVFAVPNAGLAETISVGRLPLKPGKAGFVMDIDMEPVSGNGYHPFHLKFSPLGKSFTHDRHLTVIIEPRYFAQTEVDFAFRKAITLPEGSASWSVPIYVPHYVQWDQIHVILHEDGRQIETGERVFPLGKSVRTQFANQQVAVGILVAADASKQDANWKLCPDVRTLVTVLGEGPIPEETQVDRLTHAAALKQVESVQPAWVQFRPLDESSLSDHWFAYSQLDVIIVAAPVLARIETQQPAKLVALKQWVASGGNLWTYAMEAAAKSTFQSDFLGSLQQQTPKPKGIVAPGKSKTWLNLASDNDTSDLVYEQWNGVQKQSQHYSFNTATTLEKRSAIYQQLKDKKHVFTTELPVAEITTQIKMGEYGLGSILTIADEDPFPGSFQFWQSVSNLHEEGQLKWIDRMGIDVPQGNDNYWMWLIPSVGQPPVKSFVLLNTLFAILVGPVCYFFLRRRDRLYLLYFVAPIMALVVSAALFAYAIYADGTRTKVRSRQLTWIDSANECSTGLSRQTYYAVLGRRGGIQFPTDAAVYPVRNTPPHDWYYQTHGRSGRLGEYVAGNESQSFAGSFLPPRDQVQYLTIRPNADDGSSIAFHWSEDKNTVTHNFPFLIRRLAVRDSKGAYWEASNVAAGSSALLVTSSQSVLNELIDRDVLPPLDSVPMLQKNLSRRVGRPAPGVQVSALETKLEVWSKNLPNRSFIGIADIVGEQIGVDGALVLDSVHVVLGEVQ